MSALADFKDPSAFSCLAAPFMIVTLYIFCSILPLFFNPEQHGHLSLPAIILSLPSHVGTERVDLSNICQLPAGPGPIILRIDLLH